MTARSFSRQTQALPRFPCNVAHGFDHPGRRRKQPTVSFLTGSFFQQLSFQVGFSGRQKFFARRKHLLIALHYATLHYATLRNATLHTTQHNTTHHNTTLHYTTPHYTQFATLPHITLHYTTLHYITLHYATLVTPPQMHLQLHYTNCTTPQLQLHYTTTTTTAELHHTTSSSCGWGDRPGDHCNHCSHSKKQLQPPFGPSVASLCHPWLTTTKLSYRFLIFETSATALCGTTGKYTCKYCWRKTIHPFPSLCAI